VSLAQRKEVRRAQLEAQHSQRGKMGAMPPPPQMYPPQAPMFYAPGIPPRNFMYPQQMVPRNFRNPGQGPPQMMVNAGPAGARHPGGVNYQLMPVPNGNRQQPAPNQRGNRNRRNNGAPNGMPQGQKQGAPQGQPRRPMPQQGGRPAEESTVVTAEAEESSLTIKALAAAPQGQQKQIIGERLFPLIHARESSKAGKITGMLLEMDNGELIHLLESEQARNDKIDEALAVLAAADGPDE